MQILITGAKGQLGSRLMTVLSKNHDVTGYDITDLDICNFPMVQSIINEMKPQLVINAAAWTDVDGCAKNPEKAIAINGYGAQNLAIATQEINASIMHISSNEVFDGKMNRPYYEYDAMNPVNSYGYSKMVGEKSVAQTNPRHYIVRTSWLFAHGGHNFIHAILGAVKAGKNLKVVVDEVANPTYNNDLVDAIAQLIETQRYGIYHFSNSGSTSRYNFAHYLLDKAGFQHIEIGRISRNEWARPSTPPVYTSMANLNARNLGIELRDWREAVDTFLEKENLIQTITE